MVASSSFGPVARAVSLEVGRLLRDFRKSLHHRPITRRSEAQNRWAVEVLESRQLLSAAILEIHGTAGADIITLDESWGMLTVNGAAQIVQESGDIISTEFTSSGFASNQFASGQFQSGGIVIFCGDGNDTVSWPEGLSAGVTVYGGDGDDLIMGLGDEEAEGGEASAEANMLSLAGNSELLFAADVVYGGDGDDYLQGDSGDDFLDGGNGNDSLFGALGNDTLLGGAGNDELTPGTGYDTIEGGTGSDKYVFKDAGTASEIDVLKEIGNAQNGGLDVLDFSLVTRWALVNLRGGEHGADASGSPRIKVAWTINRDVLLTNDVRETAYDFENVIGGTSTEPTDTNRVVGNANTTSVAGGNSKINIDCSSSVNAVSITSGGGNDTLIGGSHNDNITGGPGVDVLTGNGGNDTMYGNGGSDLLDGGNGDDWFDGGAVADTMIGGDGYDTVSYESRGTAQPVTVVLLQSGTSLHNGEAGEEDQIELVDNITGGSGYDRLTGSTTQNTIIGGAGNDIIYGNGGNDSLDGGAGDDWFDGGTGADTMLGGLNFDTVSYATRTANVTVTGTSAGNGEAGENDVIDVLMEKITGGSGNDRLTGSSTQNTIIGGAGDDWISGGAGDDRLEGGLGSDRYVFAVPTSNETDSIVEAYGALDCLDFTAFTVLQPISADMMKPTDPSNSTIIAEAGLLTVKRLAGANVDNLFESILGGSGNDTLVAGNYESTIIGGAGHDTLLGGAAADSLDGGDGDDVLDGKGGNDRITGGNGNDSISGGIGWDAMIGGEGHDTYTMDGGAQDSDTITEASGGGIDTLNFSAITSNVTVNLMQVNFVISPMSVSGSAAQIENVIGGQGNDIITGNLLPHSLSGGAGDDTLKGESAADTLEGGEDDDTYIVQTNSGADALIEVDGTRDALDFSAITQGVTVNLATSTVQIGGVSPITGDLRQIEKVFGGEAADIITGNSLDNTLVGGKGADTLIGGAGNDTYLVNDGDIGTDVITETAGIDTLDLSRVAGSMTISLSNGSIVTGAVIVAGDGGQIEKVFGGRAADSITGNLLRNTIYGGSGDDVINGVSGGVEHDYLWGDGGNDVFITLDGAEDFANGGAGVDSFQNRDTADQTTWVLNTSLEHYVSAKTVVTRNGTEGSPWGSITDALDNAALTSGDVLYIDGGFAGASNTPYTYAGGFTINKPNITFQGYGDSKPIIHFEYDGWTGPDQDNDGQREGDLNSNGIQDNGEGWGYLPNGMVIGALASGTRLIGLEITGGYYALKVANDWDDVSRTGSGTTGVIVENCSLHSSAFDVVKLTPGTNNSIIRGSEIYKSGLAVARGDNPNAEGIDAVNADNATLEDSEIHHVASNGVYYKGGSRNTVIQRNFIHDIGFSGITMGQDTDYEFFDSGTLDTELYESIGSVTKNNVIIDCRDAGIVAWAAKDASILNNTILNVGQTGRAGIQVTYQWHYNTAGTLFIRPSTNVTIKNNVVSMAPNNAANGRPAIAITYQKDLENGVDAYGLDNDTYPHLSSNRYYSPNSDQRIFWDQRDTDRMFLFADWATYAGETGNSGVGNPMLDSAGHLLSSTSPCFNVGDDLTGVVDDYNKVSRVLGDYDIGAFELIS